MKDKIKKILPATLTTIAGRTVDERLVNKLYELFEKETELIHTTYGKVIAGLTEEIEELKKKKS